MPRRLRLLVASAPLFAVLACHRPTPPPDDGGPPAVTIAKPLVKKMSPFADFTGQVKAPETVNVRPRVSGYISKIDFKDGQEVKAGDTLVEIDPVIYAAQLKQAEGEVKDYQAELKLHMAELAMYTDLIKKGSISQNEYDQSVAKRDVSEAKLFTSKAQVEQAKQNLDWTKVTAPIGGKVDRIFLTPGNVAVGGQSEGSVLTTLVSVDPMYAYLDIDEQSVLAYQKLMRENKAAGAAHGAGIPIKLKLMTEPDFTHPASLDFVSNQINPSTGSLQVRATVPNPAVGGVRTFQPGFFVRARLPLGGPVDTVLVPPQAVVTDQGNKVVYVVGADNKAKAVRVKLGPMIDGLQRIDAGVGPDDRVVIRGMIRVQDGVAVAPETDEVKERPGR
jgi:RND family efflux transporter MFP subunit